MKGFSFEKAWISKAAQTRERERNLDGAWLLQEEDTLRRAFERVAERSGDLLLKMQRQEKAIWFVLFKSFITYC